MKNIYLIPTDKPSRLRYFNDKLELMYLIPKKSDITFQHIYITSDDEIKEGEKCITFGSDKCKGQLDTFQSNVMYSRKPQKIILTTDVDLIKDGVQAIDDEFLQWYVKNPSCECVEVSEDYFKPSNMVYGHNTEHYKIIIPKEPKPIHQQIIDIVGGEDRFREIANLKPKQETLKKVEENIDREEWIHFFKNNSKEEILEYLIKYKFPL
jgi:hypothetical protein